LSFLRAAPAAIRVHTLSLHDALPICLTTKLFPARSHGPLTAADLEATSLKPLAPLVDKVLLPRGIRAMNEWTSGLLRGQGNDPRSEEHTSELQSRENLVCRLLLEKKK